MALNTELSCFDNFFLATMLLACAGEGKSEEDDAPKGGSGNRELLGLGSLVTY